MFKKKKKNQKVKIDKPRKSTYAQSDQEIQYESPWTESKKQSIKEK